MLFDTHCHLMDEKFSEDLHEVLMQARDVAVTRIIIPGIDVETSKRAVEIANQYKDFGVYAAVGIHPEAAKDVLDEDYAAIRELAKQPKVVAIGEIGLDYYWNTAPREEQQKVMRVQITLAEELGLPIVIHNRDATADTLSILQESAAGRVRGVMHCFTGSYETAMACIKMGFYISFGGPVTFKNAKNVHAVASQIPLDALLIETDAPYLTPHPNRGKRNEPAQVRFVAERLAELQKIDLDVLCQATYSNACKLFTKVIS